MSARRRQSERNVRLDHKFGTPHRSCLAGGELYRRSMVSFAEIRLNINEIERQTMNERRGEVDKRPRGRWSERRDHATLTGLTRPGWMAWGK
jgi:hypothetical protein